MKFVSIDSVKNTLTKQRADIAIDLSAIAKGYGVDEIARTLDRLKIAHYLVEVGGELRGKGKSSRNQPWQVGIESRSPRHGRYKRSYL